MLAQHVVGIVIDEINFRADINALPRRADDERSLAAFRDGEHHVPAVHAEVVDLFFSESSEVLEALDRLDEREIAASHHRERAALPVFGRRRTALLPEIPPDGSELDAQSSGGAAAGEINIPAILQ